ncbi:ABC transporter permease subunit [Streptomyces longwoodensis]|uniref:ABC transporter permease subunit n=1 Tax=Streptomyces longwoodensis TaxID=68231 RepID=UPI0033DB19A0
MTSGLRELVLKGTWTTIQLLVLSALLAAAVSFAVGIARTHRLWVVRFLAGLYTEVFRGTSALVMIFWVFFVLPPAFGWQLVPLWAGTLALGLTYGAYGTEIVRGALAAVPPFSNLLVELLKGTALVSVMGMGDLAFSGNLTRLMRGLEHHLKAGVR